MGSLIEFIPSIVNIIILFLDALSVVLKCIRKQLYFLLRESFGIVQLGYERLSLARPNIFLVVSVLFFYSSFFFFFFFRCSCIIFVFFL